MYLGLYMSTYAFTSVICSALSVNRGCTYKCTKSVHARVKRSLVIIVVTSTRLHWRVHLQIHLLYLQVSLKGVHQRAYLPVHISE